MESSYEVIIIGGSYAGLSAALALGRSLRKVLIIDSNNPCNRQAQNVHNLLLADGEERDELISRAKLNVDRYPSVSLEEDIVTDSYSNGGKFFVTTNKGKIYTAKKLLFATGLINSLPDTRGFKSCWGISVLHCAYCHGYEVKNKLTGIVCNGNMAVQLYKVVSNLNLNPTIITDGASTISEEDARRISGSGSKIIEKQIAELRHSNGHITDIMFTDGTVMPMETLYYFPEFKQQCLLPIKLGCRLDHHGLIETDIFHHTCVDGVFAAGDNSSFGRSVTSAIAAGNVAGMMINKELLNEAYTS